MTEIQKKAVKEVLHLVVDKELGTVITELMGRLPGVGGVSALTIWKAVEPIVLKSIDQSIDSI